MNYKAYDKYKDSGIDWLGEIPEGWEVRRFGDFYKSRMGETILANQLLENGKVPVLSATEEDNIFGYLDTANVVLKEGDIVIPARGSSIGHVKLISFPCTSTQTTILCQSLNKSDPKYTKYHLLGLRNILFYFDRTAIPQVTVEQIKSNIFLIPPISEQKTIANFLDHKIKEIDDLIAKKEELLKLLAEKRTALITNAVTKGLNPNAKMKDVGIAWLGDIPEQSKVERLDHTAKIKTSNVDKKIQEDEALVKLCNYVDIYYNEKITSEINFMEASASFTEIEKFKLKKGDVVLTKDSESPSDIGIPALIEENIDSLVCGYHLAVLESIPNKTYGGYLYYAIKSRSSAVQFEVLANGVTRFGLSKDDMKSLLIVLPSIEDQKIIADFLDKKTSEIDQTTTKIKEAIERLKEYRTSLITNAVTGKINVLNFSGNL